MVTPLEPHLVIRDSCQPPSIVRPDGPLLTPPKRRRTQSVQERSCKYSQRNDTGFLAAAGPGRIAAPRFDPGTRAHEVRDATRQPPSIIPTADTAKLRELYHVSAIFIGGRREPHLQPHRTHDRRRRDAGDQGHRAQRSAGAQQGSVPGAARARHHQRRRTGQGDRGRQGHARSPRAKACTSRWARTRCRSRRIRRTRPPSSISRARRRMRATRR